MESEPRLSILLTTTLPLEIPLQVINPNGMVVDMWKPHVRVFAYKVQKEQQKCVFCSQLDSEGAGLRDIMILTTLVGALLPFVGDFMNIIGAVSVIP